MGKSRRSSSVMKSIKSTASKTLPTVDKGLKTVGKTAKDVASASIPIVEKGVSAVYGTMATGLDLGVKGVKSVASKTRSVSRSLAGGRRRRHTRRRSRRHRRRY